MAKKKYDRYMTQNPSMGIKSNKILEARNKNRKNFEDYKRVW